MSLEEFEKLVEEATDNLPDAFREKLDNVQIVVEQWPNPQLSKGGLLLGLYQGVPQGVWGRGLGVRLPDKITIFQKPIEWISRGDAESIKRIVADTVQHEVAHHFGITDEKLRELNK